jgi:hypothetical protein
MSYIKWNAMSFSDAQQFRNVPAVPSMGYERVPDSNPSAPFDWRLGVRVERENIPSMIIGQDGWGRSRKHMPKGKTVLDILIAREERYLASLPTKPVTTIIHVTIPNRYPSDSPKWKEAHCE